MKDKIFLLFAGLLLVYMSCTKQEEALPTPTDEDPFECPVGNFLPKETRSIGLDLLDVADNSSFDANIQDALELGIDFIALHVQWSDLEVQAEVYSDPFDAISLLSQVAQDNDMKFSLTIRPIDLTGKTVPSDLESTNFNDSEMISRFQALLDHVLALMDPAVLHNVMIGNEIDGYDTSSESADFWSHYGAFLFEAASHIHAQHPDLDVGFTGTLHGLVNEPTIFGALTTAVDIMGVTYYPLNGDFTIDDPNVVMDDLSELVGAYPGVRIHLQELGYQTSSLCNSSQNKQAEFFCEFFSAWDVYKDEIESASILRLNDLSEQHATDAAGPYGVSVPEFIEYLRTLGIKDFGGSEKNAYDVIKMNLQARGW